MINPFVEEKANEAPDCIDVNDVIPPPSLKELKNRKLSFNFYNSAVSELFNYLEYVCLDRFATFRPSNLIQSHTFTDPSMELLAKYEVFRIFTNLDYKLDLFIHLQCYLKM